MPDAGRNQTYDDEQLVRYLVGSLDEHDTERFDELSISDDEFADRLRAVENDLIDAHSRGELSSDVRARFEAHYLSRPDKLERTRFAKAWVLRQGRAASANAGTPSPEPGYRSTRRTVVWPLAAAAAIVIVVLGYVLLGRTKLLAPATQPAPPAVATERPNSASPGTGPDSTTAIPPPAPVALVLMPSTRGAREIPSLSIPPGATTVEIRLVLDGDDFPTYDVALKDFEGERALWNAVGLRSSASGEERVVVVAIDPHLMKPQRYTLELSGHRASGRSEVITSYPFRVMSK